MMKCVFIFPFVNTVIMPRRPINFSIIHHLHIRFRVNAISFINKVLIQTDLMINQRPLSPLRPRQRPPPSASLAPR